MNTRVTVALSEMAAAEEKKSGSIPSEDTASIIDDVLSVSEGIKFFGKKTQTYRKTGDDRSGSYCTIPVRYDFADKESRIYAETMLRDKCKVQCTTPYPTILRESIRQVMNHYKSVYPNNYIRVSVDCSGMTLKVARRPMVESTKTGKKQWVNIDGGIPIPDLALDIYARKVPDGFKVVITPDQVTDMDVGTQQEVTSQPDTQNTAPPQSANSAPSGSGPGSGTKTKSRSVRRSSSDNDI
jgi:hypothetical protein